MELSNTTSPYDLADPLNSAELMMYALLKNDSRSFDGKLNRNEAHFPLTCAKYEAFGRCQVSKMAVPKVHLLKQALESDIQTLAAKAHAEAQQPKTMFGEALPTDLDECLKTLEEIKKRKKSEIQKLEEEIENIDEARATTEQIQKNQDAADRLVPALKKQKI
jgi:hypothetical protein